MDCLPNSFNVFVGLWYWIIIFVNYIEREQPAVNFGSSVGGTYPIRMDIHIAVANVFT